MIYKIITYFKDKSSDRKSKIKMYTQREKQIIINEEEFKLIEDITYHQSK